MNKNTNRFIKNLGIAAIVIFLFNLAISMIIGVIYFLAVTNDKEIPKEEMPSSVWEAALTTMEYISYGAFGVFLILLALHLHDFFKGAPPYRD